MLKGVYWLTCNPSSSSWQHLKDPMPRRNCQGLVQYAHLKTRFILQSHAISLTHNLFWNRHIVLDFKTDRATEMDVMDERYWLIGWVWERYFVTHHLVNMIFRRNSSRSGNWLVIYAVIYTKIMISFEFQNNKHSWIIRAHKTTLFRHADYHLSLGIQHCPHGLSVVSHAQ